MLKELADNADPIKTLVDLLRFRAEKQPKDLLYTFLSDQDGQVEERTYAELDEKARAIACTLNNDLGLSEGRALMLYPSGLEFVEAFFGCLYAGLVAVPAYPPRKNQKLGRLQSIIDNCQPAVVLTSSDVLRIAKPLFDEVTEGVRADLAESSELPAHHIEELKWLSTNEVAITNAQNWISPEINEETLAFLQYTSGSTGDPKGVMVSHKNILVNEEMIRVAFGFEKKHKFVSWLPMFHDMGLIGTTLHPIYLGASSVLMSPASFLRQPLRWLKAISDYRADVSVAPNFAYELCVEQISEEQKLSLDLSCWSHALSGAEPVRAETLERFSLAFEKQGFAWESYYPVYGMAETTLIITGGGSLERPRIETVSAQDLAKHQFRLLGDRVSDQRMRHSDELDMVGVGEKVLDQEVLIVNPDTHECNQQAEVGEIWVAGDHVASGYWNNESLSKEIFEARIKSASGELSAQNYLRTGDLGCFVGKELFITGRIKEIIIIRGRNYYPHDIELTAQQSHSYLKTDASAAFSIEVRGEEQVVLFLEVERKHRLKVNIDDVASAVRKAVAREHGLQVYAIYLLKPGRVPKTSSGKIQRHACKRAYENDSIEVIAKSIHQLDIGERFNEISIDRKDLYELTDSERKGELIAYLRASAAVLLNVDVHEVYTEQALTSLGLDSLQVTQLVSRIRETLHVELAINELFDLDSLSEVADLILEMIKRDPELKIEPIQPQSPSDELSLSFSQKRLWFLDQLEPGNSAYNNPAALTIRGKLDVRILCQVIEEIVRRHSVLRTSLKDISGGAVPYVNEVCEWHLPLEDLSALSVAARKVEVKCLASEEAACTFDLKRGQLFRTRLLQLAEVGSNDEEYVLLLTAHHIVSDGWSLNVLLEELVSLYSSYVMGQPSSLPDLHIQYYDFANWQQQWLKGDVLQRQLKYWKESLTGVPALELPLDHARPPVLSQRGRQAEFVIPKTLTTQLKKLSLEQGATLFMTLFSSFSVLLHRYSGQEDFAIGTPIANRTRAELEKLIGFFVNTLALRVDLSNNPTFIELLARVQEVTLGAYAHQDVPFERLVEELGVVRDMSHSPLFQVMFSFQNSPINLDAGLAELDFELMAVHGQSAKFDLSLDLRETVDGIAGYVEYNTALFEDTTIERFVQHFVNLLDNIVADPGENVAGFDFLSSDELKHLLVDLNDNHDDGLDRELCIHQWFEQQVDVTPKQIAVSYNGQDLSYRELNDKANQIARFLLASGIEPGALVGICLGRSNDLLTVMLAVLKVGAVYVPLDPEYPSARLEQIIYAAEAEFLICDEGLRDELPTNDAVCIFLEELIPEIENNDVHNVNVDVSSGDLAYVIYTSGSTGVPKGVAIEHRSTSALIFWANKLYSRSELEAVLASTSICFDLSVFEFFVPLSCGGKVVIVDNVLDLLSKSLGDISLINTVPSAIASLERESAIPVSVRTINLAGEPLAPQLVDRLYETGHVARVYDLYGPSEDTTYSTVMLRERFGYASIGRPVTNTQAYILDKYLKPVPQGVPGELYLGGAGLARGYYEQEAMTQERFIDNPFKIQKRKGFGDRLYKTGDLARYLSNGDIEYLGRTDFQVKVRGFRIELGEVQSALLKIRNIRDAIAIVRDDAARDQVLVAYVVFNEGREVDGASANSFLRSKLKEVLPAYMAPSIFVIMDKIPLTPNGKVDRQALPVPDFHALRENDYKEPRNEFEQGVAEIWSSVLGLKRVGIYDNFFELGGHSLLATQVVARIRETFQVEMAVRTIFDQPTIFELSNCVNDASKQGDLFPQEIHPSTHKHQIPLSFSQQRLWFLHLLDKESAAYNMPAMLTIKGPLKLEVLRSVFVEIVSRHESLRTSFYVEDGQAYQKVNMPPASWHIEEYQLKNEGPQRTQIKKIFYEESVRPFDLELGGEGAARERLLKTGLIRISNRENILLVNMHHIVSDGWSMGLLLKEMKVLYEAFKNKKASPLAPLRLQYSDYAVWQRQWVSGTRLDNQLSYWKEQLEDVAILELPSDRSRPPVQTNNGAREKFALNADLAMGLHKYGRDNGVTLFMVMLAGFKALLYRYTGQGDIAVGTPIANRTHPEWESLIGFFINTLVLRTNLDESQSFEQLVKQVQEVTLEGYANQDLPFDKLVEELNLNRNISHTPLFQVVFTLQNNAVSEAIKIDKLDIEVESGETNTAKFDLTMELQESEGEIRGSVEYNTDLFNAKTIQSFIEHYEILLNGLLEKPKCNISEIPLLSPTEQTLLIERGNAAATVCTDLVCLHQQFESQALSRGNEIAVISDGDTVSYQDLNERANRLARVLIQKGLKPKQLLPLFVERSIDMVVGILATLKAGAGYVPIDPMTPNERVDFIVRDVCGEDEKAIVLSESSLLGRLGEKVKFVELVCIDEVSAKFEAENQKAADEESLSNLNLSIDLDAPAYVIYTSGTTGLPKGVVVSHENVSRLFASSSPLFEFNSEDVWTLFHSFSFDFSVWELWGALIYGGKLIVIPQVLSRSVDDFYQLLIDEKVTILNQTPSAFSQLTAVDQIRKAKLSLRKVIFGGEALDFASLKSWVGSHGFDDPVLINMYGITETTVHVTHYQLSENDLNAHQSIIGSPLPDLQAYVLDSFYTPVPKGVVGELFVSGAGVASTYLNRPDLSSEKFITKNIAGLGERRMYRTGDLVRVMDDGQLEYLGRIDDQVKIRGFRIELGEIEFNISALPEVRECVVMIKSDTQGEDAIVAYVAVNDVSEVFTSDLRAGLVGKLPEYMIPKAFVLLNSLPLTVNGKVDKKSLSDPDWSRLSSHEYISPRNETEEVLAEVWAEVLKIETVGIYDNFFEIGGHSLLATQIVSRIRDRLDVEVPLNVIFETPTIADVALVLIENEASDLDEALLNELLDEIEGLEPGGSAEDESQKGGTSDGLGLGRSVSK